MFCCSSWGMCRPASRLPVINSVTEELLGDCVLFEPSGGAVGVGSSVEVTSYCSLVRQHITCSHRLLGVPLHTNCYQMSYRGADKSLARPGRKQTTATKLLTFASQFKKKSEGCPSNQVSAAAMTSASDEKWRPFNCFFSRVGLRTYQYSCTLI